MRPVPSRRLRAGIPESAPQAAPSALRNRNATRKIQPAAYPRSHETETPEKEGARSPREDGPHPPRKSLPADTRIHPKEIGGRTMRSVRLRANKQKQHHNTQKQPKKQWPASLLQFPPQFRKDGLLL